MAASYQTIDEVIKVIRRHVNDDTFQKIVIELQTVKGNSSFETTMKQLYDSVVLDK